MQTRVKAQGGQRRDGPFQLDAARERSAPWASRGLVARLTRTHEAKQAKPWKMTDSPKEFIDSMLTKIVGINIDITGLIGKFKISQNKELQDILGAGHALVEQSEEVMGNAMLAYAATQTSQT